MTDKHDIIWIESTDSTNDAVRRQVDDMDNLSVLAAECQTSGRGQKGNSWYSSYGENLTFSILMKAEVSAVRQFIISQISALAVVSLLKNHNIEASVKWPNDIYVSNRKICGILIENTLRGAMIRHSIIGIGLNVNQEHFTPDIPRPTSMKMMAKKDFDPHKLLEEFVSIFKKYASRLSSEEGEICEEYHGLLWRKDEIHQFHDNKEDHMFYGRIKGVNSSGCLLIESEEGGLKQFAFKEISYII